MSFDGKAHPDIQLQKEYTSASNNLGGARAAGGIDKVDEVGADEE